jgi:hypothetical protein
MFTNTNIKNNIIIKIAVCALVGANLLHAMGEQSKPKRGKKRRAAQELSALEILASEPSHAETASPLDILAGVAQQTREQDTQYAQAAARTQRDIYIQQAHAQQIYAQQLQAQQAYQQQQIYVQQIQAQYQQEFNNQVALALWQQQAQLQQLEQQRLLQEQAIEPIIEPEQAHPEIEIPVPASEPEESLESQLAKARMPQTNKSQKTYERKQIKIAAAKRFRAEHDLPELTIREIATLDIRQPGMCPKGCPTIFTRLDSVISHMETTHSNDRPHPCIVTCEDGNLCAYAAKKPNDLTKHMNAGKHSSTKKTKSVYQKYQPYVAQNAPAQGENSETQDDSSEQEKENQALRAAQALAQQYQELAIAQAQQQAQHEQLLQEQQAQQREQQRLLEELLLSQLQAAFEALPEQAYVADQQQAVEPAMEPEQAQAHQPEVNQQQATSRIKIPCPECAEPLGSEQLLEQHLLEEHSNIYGAQEYTAADGTSPIICPECGEPLGSESLLAHHLLGVHSNIYGPQAYEARNDLECPCCLEKMSIDALEAHMPVAHSAELNALGDNPESIYLMITFLRLKASLISYC